jgi:hypothetical protein
MATVVWYAGAYLYFSFEPPVLYVSDVPRIACDFHAMLLLN